MNRQITKRLTSGQDLRNEIEKLVEDYRIQAGVLLSIVGGLQKAVLRMAGGELVKTWEGRLEIVAGTGTVSVNGCHIHIVVSDVDGRTFGGHLKQGCTIATTAEIVIAAFEGTKYRRVGDPETGYDELVVE